MTRILILILILTTTILTSACTGRNGRLDLTKPASLDMRAPAGPPTYRQGWQDGCESGLSATGDKVQLFLQTHVYTLDATLRYNKLYAKAWRYGYDHCSFSMKSMSSYKYL